jgi:hypothetical protein
LLFRVVTRSRALGAVTAALAGPLLALAFAGCDLLAKPAEPPRDPSLVGVVDRIELSGRTADVALETGQTLRLDLTDVPDLAGSGPRVGELLLYGELPSPWRASLAPTDEGDAFEALTTLDDRADGWVTLGFGVRLPVAAGYRPSGAGPSEPGAPVLYLINEKGQVIAGP